MKRRSDSDEAGVPTPLPRRSPRELAEDWMRALTITVTSSSDTTPDQLFHSVAQVNQPGAVRVELSRPLPPADARAVADAMAWVHGVRSDQAKVNMLVDALLIQWLAEAAGQDRAAVVQRLALAVEALLPPT